jgi:hypothetical protein
MQHDPLLKERQQIDGADRFFFERDYVSPRPVSAASNVLPSAAHHAEIELMIGQPPRLSDSTCNLLAMGNKG